MLRLITIATVKGFAFGGVCELVMSCNFRIPSVRVKFGQSEVGLKITYGFSDALRLPKLVANPIGKEIILAGDIINVEEAEIIGLSIR